MKALGRSGQRCERHGEKLIWTWIMDKEGATLKNREGSKFLDKRSTQVGGASS
jgi:hypothetical protein